MKKNLGNIDKTLRTLFALVVAVLYFTNVITGTLGLVLLIVGIVLLLTAFVSFCPIYAIFGINTCKVPEKK